MKSVSSINFGSVRPSRKWWAIDGPIVKEVTGYSCAPENPNTWWCPEVGFSGTEGYQLFETESQALDAAILRQEQLLCMVQAGLEKLKIRGGKTPLVPTKFR